MVLLFFMLFFCNPPQVCAKQRFRCQDQLESADIADGIAHETSILI